MEKCKLCGSAEHDELNHNGLVDERLEELNTRNKELEDRLNNISALLSVELCAFGCPAGSINVYVTEEAVAQHLRCPGTSWDEECPDCEDCWNILLSKNEVKQQLPKGIKE